MPSAVTLARARQGQAGWGTPTFQAALLGATHTHPVCHPVCDVGECGGGRGSGLGGLSSRVWAQGVPETMRGTVRAMGPPRALGGANPQAQGSWDPLR